MLRHVEDYTARRLPDRNGTIRIVVSAALATLVLLTGPAAAHSGHANAAAVPSSYVPYLGNVGDPAGLTSSGTRQSGKAMFVAHAAHAGISADNPLANKVREVNARFADVGVATAEG